MISKIIRGMVTAAFLVASTGDPAHAQYNPVEPLDSSVIYGMDDFKPMVFLNWLSHFAARHHFNYFSERHVKRLLRQSMNESLGPHHSKQPKTDLDLAETVAHRLMTNFDSHSQYKTDEEYRAYRDAILQNITGGIGVKAAPDNGTLFVETVENNTPAAVAHIFPGDRITHVDGRRLADMKIKDYWRILSGIVGSPVNLTIERDGIPLPGIVLKREKIEEEVVESAVMDGNIAYIKLNIFSSGASLDIQESLEKMDLSKLNGAILDLRGNTGGLLSEAVKIADLFMESGPIVSRTKQKADGIIKFPADVLGYGNAEDMPNVVFTATPGDILSGKPLVVLINGSSASGSEVTAAALNNRAVIVGSVSFGKGSVQTMMSLFSLNSPYHDVESAVGLTTQLYFGPDGISPQAIGVKPDIAVRNTWGEDFFREADLPNIIPNPAPRTPDYGSPARCELSGAEPAQKDPLIYRQFGRKTMIDKVLLCALETFAPQRALTVLNRGWTPNH